MRSVRRVGEAGTHPTHPTSDINGLILHMYSYVSLLVIRKWADSNCKKQRRNRMSRQESSKFFNIHAPCTCTLGEYWASCTLQPLLWALLRARVPSLVVRPLAQNGWSVFAVLSSFWVIVRGRRWGPAQLAMVPIGAAAVASLSRAQGVFS